MTDRRITDARAAELARLIEATRVSVGPLGHDDDTLDDLAGWMLSHGDSLLADRAADRAEIARLRGIATVLAARLRAVEHERNEADAERDAAHATLREALVALSAAGVATPVEGYGEAPYTLVADIRRLARERDEAWAEVERLQRLLKLRDRQMVQARQQWMRAAEKALAGDTRDLWLRVEMAKQPPVDVVLSDAAPPAPDADPAVLARHAAVQAGDLSGTVDWPDPRDAVVEAARALAENIGWRGYGPDVGHYYCEHCDKKATSVAQIPHTDGCRAKRLLDALAALDAAGRQGGREP